VTEVETVILANHAEALNGLLYVSGGGWSHHWRGPRPAGQPASPSQVAFAATITASATEVVAEIPFTVLITGPGTGEVMRATGTMTIGSGDAKSERRAALAGNFGIAFPEEGRYELIVEIPGSRRRVEFWVHDQAMPAPTQPPEPPTTGPETTRGYI
jgi:hypothetical protein